MATLYKTVHGEQWSHIVPDKQIHTIHSYGNDKILVICCDGHQNTEIVCEKIKFGFD